MYSILTTFFLFVFLILTTITNPSYSARVLVDVADPPQTFQHPTQPSITFVLRDIQPTTRNTMNQQQQQQQQQQSQLPFSKPLGKFPLTFGGTNLPYQMNQNNQNFPRQTPLDMPRFGIIFPSQSTLQEELEFGLVTNIEEDIYVESSGFGPTSGGKAKGVYVATSSFEGGSNSHMIAMTVSLFSSENGDEKSNEVDSLKFFGVHGRDTLECHVAVIGGSGKFKDANGYAIIERVSSDKESTDIDESSEEAKMMLLYNVYLLMS